MNMIKGSKTRIERWFESSFGISMYKGHRKYVSLYKVLYIYDNLYRLKYTLKDLIEHGAIEKTHIYYYSYIAKDRMRYDSFTKGIYLLYLQEELEKGYKGLIVKK